MSNVMFYCVKCHKRATKRHKCNPLSYISITSDMRCVVDRLVDDLGFKVYSAVHYIENVDRSFLHKIELEIEFNDDYSETLLQSMPTGWNWYKFDVRDGDILLSGLRYNEDYLWTGDGTVTDRVNKIIADFMEYLGTRDPQAFRAVLTLHYS